MNEEMILRAYSPSTNRFLSPVFTGLCRDAFVERFCHFCCEYSLPLRDRIYPKRIIIDERRTPGSASAKRESQREDPALKAGSLVTRAITFRLDKPPPPQHSALEAILPRLSINGIIRHKAIGMKNQ